MRICVAIFFRRRFLELLRFTLSLALSHEEKGIMALKINHYRIFCNLSPLPAGEGIMVLKPTIIGLSATCPLSPWERARERAKPQI